jgi:hypothetical protein
MSSVSDPGFDQRIADWLEEDPDVAPPVVLETVVAAVPSISQRRAWRIYWRFPTMLRVAAAFAAIAFTATALALLPPRQSPPGAVSSPTPTAAGTEIPSASPTATDTATSVGDYRAARDAICHASGLALNPLKLRFLGAFDGSLSDAQLNDWTAALDQFSAGYDQLTAQLSALQPPPALALKHALNVLDIEEQNILIRRVAVELRYKDWTGASTDDAATNPIGARTVAFESQNTLEPCP